MGVVRLPGGLYRRVDILTIPFVNWGAALLYFTGNEVFNRSLRLYARKKGFSLNQRGLYKEVIRDKQGNKTTEGEWSAKSCANGKARLWLRGPSRKSLTISVCVGVTLAIAGHERMGCSAGGERSDNVPIMATT